MILSVASYSYLKSPKSMLKASAAKSVQNSCKIGREEEKKEKKKKKVDNTTRVGVQSNKSAANK